MKVLGVKNMALVDGITREDKQRLTFFKTSVVTEQRTEIRGYKVTDKGVLIPRGYIPSLLTQVQDAGWETVAIPFIGTLNQAQAELVSLWLSQGQGIISAGTGTGKTVMALYIASKIGLKTLVVVPSDRLLFQWAERIKTFCGFKPGIIKGSICETEQPITVAMLQTLALGTRINKKQLFKMFGLTIYDECHRLPTEKFNVVAGMFWDKHRLGLSATPDRKDGCHLLFFYHLGGVIKRTLTTGVIPKVTVIRYMDFKIGSIQTLPNGKPNLARYFNSLATCSSRNLLIAILALKSFKQGRTTLILSDRLELLDRVAYYLRPLQIGWMTGQRKEIAPIILGTFGSGGEGLDIPTLDCLILATPRTDIRQSVGRLLRPKNHVPIVVDIVDNSSALMRSFFHKRLSTYKAMGCQVEEIFVSGEEALENEYKKILATVLETKKV